MAMKALKVTDNFVTADDENIRSSVNAREIVLVGVIVVLFQKIGMIANGARGVAIDGKSADGTGDGIGAAGRLSTD